mgnify:CR=1 FL=1
MYQTAVGEPFDGPIPISGQAAFMELSEGGGFCILIYLPDITSKEAHQMRKGKLEFRFMREKDFVFTLLGLGKMQFEFPFNPAKYSPERQKDLFMSNMATIIAVDTRSTLVRAIRYVSIPLGLWEVYKECWPETDKQEYELWVDSIMRRYAITDLWAIAKKGE